MTEVDTVARPDGDAAFDESVADAAPRAGVGERIAAWGATRTGPQLLLAAVLVAYTWWYTERSLNVHHALGTSSYDSALYDQGVWLLSRFEARRGS